MIQNKMRDLFLEIKATALDYAPDQEYLEGDDEAASRFEMLRGEEFCGAQSLGMAASILSEWIPDCLEEDDLAELNLLLTQASVWTDQIGH